MSRPTEPAAPRRRGLGPAFWAMIAFGFLAAVAGLIVGLFGPRLFPPPAHAWQAAPARLNRPPHPPDGSGPL